jgi:hypothetical protein
MELILVLAVVLSIILILVLRGETPIVPYKPDQSPKTHRLGVRPDSNPQESQKISEDVLDRLKELDLATLEKFCRKLADRSELHFLSMDPFGKSGFHILTHFDKPLLQGNVLIYGFLAGKQGVVNSSEVIGFSDIVKAERCMKGVFVTNGYFSEEVMKLNEGAAMELMDVAQLANLMQEWAPELLPSRLCVVEKNGKS